MKMYFKSLIIGTMAFIASKGLQAQSFGIGLEGEVLTSSVKIEDIPNSAVKAVNGKNIMGYEVGPYVKLGIGSIYVKPKVLVGWQKGSMDAEYDDGRTTSVDINITKLDIPLLIGLKVLGPLSVEAGPVYNKILTATKDIEGNHIELKSGGVGYRVGANAQLGILGLNVAYQGIRTGSAGSLSSYAAPDELIFGLSIGF